MSKKDKGLTRRGFLHSLSFTQAEVLAGIVLVARLL